LPDIAIGGVVATPIMRWVLERGGRIDRFNQAMLLQFLRLCARMI